MSFADVYLSRGVYQWQLVWSEDKAYSPVVSMGVACPDLLDRQGNAQGGSRRPFSLYNLCNCSHAHLSFHTSELIGDAFDTCSRARFTVEWRGPFSGYERRFA